MTIQIGMFIYLLLLQFFYWISSFIEYNFNYPLLMSSIRTYPAPDLTHISFPYSWVGICLIGAVRLM